MQTLYIIKIESKYFKKILRYHLQIKKVKKKKEVYYIYLDKNNYEKIKKLTKIYNLELVGYKGLYSYLNNFKKNKIIFIMFLLGLSLIIFLSNLILEIEIKTNDLELKNLVFKELSSYNLKKYQFVKSYQEKEKIKKEILENNKDKLEWLEITRIGSKYVINLEKRILSPKEEDLKPRDVVALKNAIILKIDATTGSIVKKLNDYVKKGDVIVSGNIIHNEEVVDQVVAKATIYGETWYNVHVSYPVAYYEKTYTGKTSNRITLTLNNKEIDFFNKKYQQEDILETKLIYHKFLPFKLSYIKAREIKLEDNILTNEEAIIKAMDVAKENILKTLPEDSKILDQKKLKIVLNNSTIDIDVFFKVYENITAYQDIILKEKEDQ